MCPTFGYSKNGNPNLIHSLHFEGKRGSRHSHFVQRLHVRVRVHRGDEVSGLLDADLRHVRREIVRQETDAEDALSDSLPDHLSVLRHVHQLCRD